MKRSISLSEEIDTKLIELTELSGLTMSDIVSMGIGLVFATKQEQLIELRKIREDVCNPKP